MTRVAGQCVAVAGRRSRRWVAARVGEDLGFTLVELLIVVTIVSVVATVALPAMSRARAAALESQAVGVLRSINGGQATYAAVCASGFYAPSLRWLTQPAAAGGGPFISPELNRNTLDRGNYRIRFRRGSRAGSPAACNGLRAGRAVVNYFVGADVLVSDGSRHFGTNQGGTVYQSTRRVRVTRSGAPPLPATPLQ